MSASRESSSTQVDEDTDQLSIDSQQWSIGSHTAHETDGAEQDDDDDFDEGYAGYVEEVNSITYSITPSITNYLYENGRRYHAYRAGSYPFPNDEYESERQETAHHIRKLVLGNRLFLAPTHDFHRVLDLGTGTGVWAIEMGDAFPQAEVLGNDLSPIQPTWVPPNVSFEVDDFESDWEYHAPFDFIFGCYLCFAVADWPRLIRQSYENLRPGGWVEFHDVDINAHSDDGSLSQSSTLSQWNSLLVQASELAGREPCPGPKLEGWVRDTGFTNVVHRKFKVPVGVWPKDRRQKEIGLLHLATSLDGCEGASMALMTRHLGWSMEEVQVMCARVRADMRNSSIHSYIVFDVVYGQKPSI